MGTTDRPRGAVAIYEMERSGGISGGEHWGTPILHEVNPSNGHVESIGRSGINVEGLLGRSLGAGTRVRVHVEVLDEHPLVEEVPLFGQHRNFGAYRWCDDCARHYWTHERVQQYLASREARGDEYVEGLDGQVLVALWDTDGYAASRDEVWFNPEANTVTVKHHPKHGGRDWKQTIDLQTHEVIS